MAAASLRLTRWLALLAGMLAAAGALADTPPELLKLLQARYPDVKVEQLRPAELPGLYEAQAAGNVFYLDASGRYLLTGALIDLSDNTNLSLLAKASQRRIDIAALPMADAFTVVRGQGRRHIVLFSDPDCPFCRELERQELPQLDDVTLHVFLYPLAELHPQARDKAVGIWCAPQRQQLWADVMLRDARPAPASCEHPVDRNVALGRALGIQSTPTLIFADGRVLGGSVPAQQIEALLLRGAAP